MSDFVQSYGAWAIVAGASDGTGAAFAEELASRGLNIVLVARRQRLLEDLAGQLPTDARVVVMDLSTAGAAAQLAAATADLDIGMLVYNAGADTDTVPFLDHSIDDLHALLRRNCATVMELCHAVGARLVARGRGGVILVSSGAAWVGGANLAAYGATKAFNLVLAEALWAEWGPQGVDVLALVLGATDTPSIRRVLAQRGGAFPHMAQPLDVVREALDHMNDGPTWAIGMPDPGSSPFGALPRRQAVQLLTQLASAIDAGDHN